MSSRWAARRLKLPIELEYSEWVDRRAGWKQAV